MRISTIMAVYNTERYVALALDSVLAQTLSPAEIVVVDDGSTDGTPDVLRAYATRVQVIRQNNYGPARALNVAIAAATGDAFAFLDADDLWVPDKLQIQHMALLAEGDLEAVFGTVQQFISPDVDPETARNYIVPRDPQPGISKITLLIRRSALERIGPFEEEYRATDFVDWYARASALGLRYRMLPEVVTLRRNHPGHLGRCLRTEQHRELLHILKGSLDLRRGKPPPKKGS
jgi:glycosyltransferase involved in cell wall biosynthesis